MVVFFGSNIKILRRRKNLTQEELALAVKTTRSTINNYENGISPSLENLLILADHFRMSVDTLLRVDLAKLSEFNLSQVEKGYDTYIKGTKLRVLATTVDSNDRENVELVSHKAKAGYAAGYSDPEFISALPKFQLPFLSKERKYRTFQIEGDSMVPIPDKSYVIGEFVQDWSMLKDGKPYILLTREEGIVFKIVFSQIKKNRTLLLKSLNTMYEPYEINVNEVVEVWRMVYYFSGEVPEGVPEMERLMEKIEELRGLAQDI